MLCDGGMWRFQVPELSQRYRVITIDAPGHGQSAPIRRAYTLEECSQAATEVMDALDVESAHWAGLSWGGMIGMRLALAYPDRLRSLALLGTSAGREPRRALPKTYSMVFIARHVGVLGFLLDQVERTFFTAETRSEHPEIIGPFRDHLATMDRASLGRAIDAGALHRVDIRDQLHAIGLPTLVAVGADDTVLPPACSRDIAELIPGARLEVIPDAAHLSALDQPTRVTELLLEFFGSVEGSTPPSPGCA